tara:strand:+ start:113 stop:1162 length:1050 start_codon:yes stop_codon:yes gene_type:complete
MFTWLGSKYNYLTRISLLLLYFLILAGGIVRCTGSGMGCPDWPKCFGKLIPPISIEELPEGYEEKFVNGRIEKNKRLGKILSFIGLDELSNKIINDPEIKVSEKFNVYKTWTEYINRLIGAIVGISLFLLFISSIYLKPFDNKIFLLSFLSIILVLFQAWLGSLVVSTNLLSGFITVHVIVALIIICNVILCYHLTSNVKLVNFKSDLLVFFIIVSFFLFFVQIVLGTNVRESVDGLFKFFGFNQRDLIIESLGINFIIHRSFSLLILIFQSITYYFILRQSKIDLYFKNISRILLVLIILEILVGVGMAYFQIPKFLQPIHLFVAFLIFGIQFYVILLSVKFKKLKTI